MRPWSNILFCVIQNATLAASSVWTPNELLRSYLDDLSCLFCTYLTYYILVQKVFN